jgi:hypothetical protein
MRKDRRHGLYVDKAGKQLVVLHRLNFSHTQRDPVSVLYSKLLPSFQYTEELGYKTFNNLFPTRVTAVEVEEGAEKAELIQRGGVYTDGEQVVTVLVIPTANTPHVSFLREYPFEMLPTKLKRTEFLETYPYRLHADSIELVY